MTSFISYSQNFEDVMLMRALQDVAVGFYIDVGAQGPTEGSVSRAFYDRGWSGINFEPVDEFIEQLAAERTRDINDKSVVGAQNGRVTFYDVLGTGLSTSVEAIAQAHASDGKIIRRRDVEMTTLDTACQKYAISTVHFLKIDTEGSERDVLLGFSFEKVRPWIVLVEATYPNSPEPNFEDWEPILLSKEYSFAYADGLNRFYVANEHSELLKHFLLPPNFFDDFVLAATDRAQKVISHHVAIIDEMGLRISNLARENFNLANDLDLTASAKLEAEAALNAVLQSTSWRITAPLRRVTSAFRRRVLSHRLSEGGGGQWIAGKGVDAAGQQESDCPHSRLPESAVWIVKNLEDAQEKGSVPRSKRGIAVSSKK